MILLHGQETSCVLRLTIDMVSLAGVHCQGRPNNKPGSSSREYLLLPCRRDSQRQRYVVYFDIVFLNIPVMMTKKYDHHTFS